MAITTIIASAQQRSKDSFASSPIVGLAVRANGEETVKVIDARGIESVVKDLIAKGVKL